MPSPNSSDRRRAERLLLDPPIEAKLAGTAVVVHEIGLVGSRVEHAVPIGNGHAELLMISWDGEEIAVDCTIARSERLTVDGEVRFTSGLSFVGAESQPVRRI